MDQSALQSFIQKMQGTQTVAQSATPAAVNNGNPNTVYNSPINPPANTQTPTWSTYVPSVVPGLPGLPQVSFNQVTAPYTPSQPGYASPFAADPTAAMVLAGVPQATGNENVNRILSRMFSGGSGMPTPAPGTPGTGTGTPPPGTGTPPGSGTTPPSTPIGSGGSQPIGPISGPIHQWITNPGPGQGVPQTAGPTNLWGRGMSREGALEWMQNTNTGRSVADWLGQHQDAFDPDTGGLREDSGVFQSLWQGIKDIPGQIGNYLRGQLRDAIGQNGAAGLAGFWGTFLGIPGAHFIANAVFPEEMVPFQLSQETMDNWEETNGELDAENALAQWERINQNFMDMVQTDGLSEAEILRRFPEYRQSWSQQEWDDMQETMGWNNFWYGSDQANTPTGAWSGTRRPTLGLPALDNMDVFLNQMNADALARSDWFRNMRGTIER